MIFSSIISIIAMIFCKVRTFSTIRLWFTTVESGIDGNISTSFKIGYNKQNVKANNKF